MGGEYNTMSTGETKQANDTDVINTKDQITDFLYTDTVPELLWDDIGISYDEEHQYEYKMIVYALNRPDVRYIKRFNTSYLLYVVKFLSGFRHLNMDQKYLMHIPAITFQRAYERAKDKKRLQGRDYDIDCIMTFKRLTKYTMLITKIEYIDLN